MRCSRRVLAAFAVFMAGFGLACDGRPTVDSSTNEATVTGTVMVKGKPATGGEILFNPANVDRPVGPRSATIGKDGTYTIKTYTGGNQIGFAGSLTTENPGLFRYKQYYEVVSGDNKKDFDLLNDAQAESSPSKSYGKGAKR